LPSDQAVWTSVGLEVELDDVLTTRTLPRQTPLVNGYVVRRLAGDDWEQSVARVVEENAQTQEEDAEDFARFAEAQVRTRRALCDRDDAAWFGAFAGDRLVAELGIVRCGSLARYQSVVTQPEHRRRGLAAHLLGVAARWAGDAGCDEWVIVTEATNPAGRVYRNLGFALDSGNAQAYRRAPTG
jgi:GNAT superfamily N-acetyltransferase